MLSTFSKICIFWMRSVLFKSIKTKVIFFVLTCFLISIWSLSFYASTILQKDMQKILEEQQFAMATIYAQQVDEGLRSRLDALDKVASIIPSYMIVEPKAMQIFLDENIVLQALFNRAIFVQNTQGDTIASSPQSLGKTGINYKDRDYVIAALEEGKTTVGTPVVGRVSKKPNFSMATPIRDEKNQIIGSLSGVITLEKSNFLDKISEVGYGKNGNYFLLSPKQRLIITSSEKDRIMETLPMHGVIPPLDHFIDGYEGSAVYINQFGIEVLTSVKQIPISGWAIAVSIPTKEIFLPIYTMQERILWGTFLLTLIVGFLLWRFLQSQFSIITDIIQKINFIATEENSFKLLPVARDDEIGKLIDSFNYLLSTLLKQKIGLEKEISKNIIIQNQLYQASKEAEIGRVVANISHQWRGVLAKVGAVNLLTLVQLKNDYPLCRVFLTQQSEEMVRLLDFMSQTMQDFLEFYKPSTIAEEFSISQTIHQALNILEKSICDSALSIEYEKVVDKKLVGFKNQWIHIWLNLISNTIAAGKTNGITAPHFKITTYDNKIIVSDNAGGASNIDNLMGIGLQMCSEIVKNHNGVLTYQNLNDGFCITIAFES